MKFRLLSGRHYEGGKCYESNPQNLSRKERQKIKCGEVVESDKDLAEIFKNKFERVEDDVPTTVKPDNPNSLKLKAKAVKKAKAKKGPEKSGKLQLKHRGGPKWDVVRKDTGEAINDEGLSKEDAQALVDAAKE